MTYRVLLVDHPIVLKAMRVLFDFPGLAVCGEASNGKEALEQAAALNPDLVVMNLWSSELRAIAEIHQRFPRIRIIALSLHDSTYIATLAKEVGADAYVVKTCAPVELIDTVRTVLGMNGIGEPGSGPLSPQYAS